MKTHTPLHKKRWEIFQAGTHTDTSGIQHTFTEADLAECASSFDLARFTPPIVKGHPAMDAPSFGRVTKLYAEGSSLYADVEMGSDMFAEIDDLKWLAVSAAFYPREHAHNPNKGKLSLRHVGLLGASPPAVKGLQNIGFAEGDTLAASMAFGELQAWMLASPFEACAEMFRRMREAMIADKGLEQADAIFPNWKIDSLLDAVKYLRDQLDTHTTTTPIFSEEPTMTEDEKQKMAALEAENTRLKSRAGALEKAQREAAQEAVHNGHVAFCEELVKSKRLLPSEVENQVFVLDQLAQVDPRKDVQWLAQQSPQFAEGEDIPSRYDAAKAALEKRPVNNMLFAEQASKSRAGGRAGGNAGSEGEHPLLTSAAARTPNK